MDLAFITPTKYLDRFATKGGVYLALAHLIDDDCENEYARFHRRESERGRRVILDNGLFEGAQVEPEALIRRARGIGAQCVCAPDVLFDSRGTIKAFKQFIRLKQETGLVAEVMGIPQADNPADWWDCFQFMELHPDCNLIGLSILSVPKAFGRAAEDAGYAVKQQPITAPRVYLIQQLRAHSHILGRDLKPCHMLGLGETYADIHTANRELPKTIVSNDSSSAFVHGVKGICYTGAGLIPGGKDSKKLNFGLQDDLSETQERCVDHNIKTALHIARDNWGRKEA